MSAPVHPSLKLYGVSVLATAAMRMWRGWRIVVPVVVVNAALQAILLMPELLPYLSLPFIVVALLSFVVLALAFGVVAATMESRRSKPLRISAGSMRSRVRLRRRRTRLLPKRAGAVAEPVGRARGR